MDVKKHKAGRHTSLSTPPPAPLRTTPHTRTHTVSITTKPTPRAQSVQNIDHDRVSRAFGVATFGSSEPSPSNQRLGNSAPPPPATVGDSVPCVAQHPLTAVFRRPFIVPATLRKSQTCVPDTTAVVYLVALFGINYPLGPVTRHLRFQYLGHTAQSLDGQRLVLISPALTFIRQVYPACRYMRLLFVSAATAK